MRGLIFVRFLNLNNKQRHICTYIQKYFRSIVFKFTMVSKILSIPVRFTAPSEPWMGITNSNSKNQRSCQQRFLRDLTNLTISQALLLGGDTRIDKLAQSYILAYASAWIYTTLYFSFLENIYLETMMIHEYDDTCQYSYSGGHLYRGWMKKMAYWTHSQYSINFVWKKYIGAKFDPLVHLKWSLSNQNYLHRA